ncbi:MAG: DegT/DnrJ/EryC1/StrS family aminotransferase [Bacteroidota bacterium]|nr:DegT/DnrJ/EryC1/StrS family aminotransferase [Candidatus Kapabacteria bacterium]MDW8075778.1 DegT/DnrJ/EryC1/StrS family aminotransferase [Bacteroidota bacterium]
MSNHYRIPVYKPSLSGNEERYVLDCIRSGWISSKGSYVDAFEQQFAAFVGARHAISVCNGTVALHVALAALGIRPGDEVIVPTFTYIAPVNAIVYCGATPIFVDSDPYTWQLDPADVSRRISPRTKAIVAVHLYGHPADVGALRLLAQEHGLFLIEDCAEAFGAYYEGKHVGTFGDVATFSFYGNKTITTGEGGMVVTDDDMLAERIRRLKGQGLAPYREYWHDIIGYNYRMTNIAAAIGLAQLEQAEYFLHRKRAIAELYQQSLAGTFLEFQHTAPNVVHSWWMVSVLTPTAQERDRLRHILHQHGIETRPTFYPVHTMPMYSHRYERHRVAESLALRGINLPSYPALSDEEVQWICQVLTHTCSKTFSTPPSKYAPQVQPQ